MATGQLDYHLNWLQNKSVIKTITDGQFIRFYTFENLDEDERTILELSRQESVRHILIHLLDSGRENHENIVNRLNLSPSTVSWHLKKLVNANILNKEIEGRKSYYHIKNGDMVKNTLIKHRASFLDKLVDHFIEMWAE